MCVTSTRVYDFKLKQKKKQWLKTAQSHMLTTCVFIQNEVHLRYNVKYPSSSQWLSFQLISHFGKLHCDCCTHSRRGRMPLNEGQIKSPLLAGGQGQDPALKNSWLGRGAGEGFIKSERQLHHARGRQGKKFREFLVSRWEQFVLSWGCRLQVRLSENAPLSWMYLSQAGEPLGED